MFVVEDRRVFVVEDGRLRMLMMMRAVVYEFVCLWQFYLV